MEAEADAWEMHGGRVRLSNKDYIYFGEMLFETGKCGGDECMVVQMNGSIASTGSSHPYNFPPA